MKPLVGLEMDEKGSLMVTYECARCREVQKAGVSVVGGSWKR